MKREDILQQAMQVITKDRQDQYGNPENNLSLIAALWSDYIGYKFRPDEVAIMMVLLKIARGKTGKNHVDNYVDMAGYTALAAEVSGSVRMGGAKYSVPLPLVDEDQTESKQLKWTKGKPGLPTPMQSVDCDEEKLDAPKQPKKKAENTETEVDEPWDLDV